MPNQRYTCNVHMHGLSTQAAEVGAVSFHFEGTDHFVADRTGPGKLFLCKGKRYL